MDVTLDFDWFPRLQVAQHVWSASPVTARFTLVTGVDASARFEVEERVGLVCREITLTAEEITTSSVAAFPVESIRRLVNREVLSVGPSSEALRPGSEATFLPGVLDEWPSGDLRKFALGLAGIYNYAALAGYGPTAAVQRAAGVSKSTAIRMIKAARVNGASLVEVPKRSGGIDAGGGVDDGS